MQENPASEQKRVHIAITRTVKPGREQEFQEAIGQFFERAEVEFASTAAYLIRPFQGSEESEYGVLRTFDDVESMERFYASDLYRAWNEAVQPLVEGEAKKHELHGMEAFFRSPNQSPPTWKMALITWLGVNPAVLLSAEAVRFSGLGPPPLVELMLVNVLVVAGLTWLIMPLLTRFFGAWLER